MKRHSSRPQRTIRTATTVTGFGFLTGASVRLRFLPAAPDTGVVFVRVDLPGRPSIAAHAEQVTDTRRRTTLGQPPLTVTLVEHVLAALAGLRIDNCTVEINGVEPPGLDGSAAGFVQALRAAEPIVQPGVRPVFVAEQPITVSSGTAILTLYPPSDDSPGLTLSYFLDYGHRSPIARQVHTLDLTPSTFAQELATSRTFILEAEAEEFRRQGLGSRTTAADLLVFGQRGPIDNVLRHANEPARHKLLDLVGDLSLAGVDLRGHVVACRSGHPLNVEMARTLATKVRDQQSAVSGQQAARMSA